MGDARYHAERHGRLQDGKRHVRGTEMVVWPSPGLVPLLDFEAGQPIEPDIAIDPRQSCQIAVIRLVRRRLEVQERGSCSRGSHRAGEAIQASRQTTARVCA